MASSLIRDMDSNKEALPDLHAAGGPGCPGSNGAPYINDSDQGDDGPDLLPVATRPSL